MSNLTIFDDKYMNEINSMESKIDETSPENSMRLTRKIKYLKAKYEIKYVNIVCLKDGSHFTIKKNKYETTDKLIKLQKEISILARKLNISMLCLTQNIDLSYIPMEITNLDICCYRPNLNNIHDKLEKLKVKFTASKDRNYHVKSNITYCNILDNLPSNLKTLEIENMENIGFNLSNLPIELKVFNFMSCCHLNNFNFDNLPNSIEVIGLYYADMYMLTFFYKPDKQTLQISRLPTSLKNLKLYIIPFDNFNVQFMMNQEYWKQFSSDLEINLELGDSRNTQKDIITFKNIFEIYKVHKIMTNEELEVLDLREYKKYNLYIFRSQGANLPS